ncbi:tnc-2 [Symbiodinium sp. CCMP2592]|nr:tnc-2 [Symbiodinium sp. CCMP2592]
MHTSPEVNATAEHLQSLEKGQLNMFVLKHLRNFHEYDKTGAGTISIPEMKAVLRTTTIGLTERDLKSVLKQADADGDGSVSFSEYLRLAQKLVEMQNKTKGKSSRIPRMYLEPAALKQYTDLFEGAAGEDGAISLNQLQEFLQQHKMAISEERLTSIMKEVDDDDSGVLELDEFLILLIKALGIKKRKVGPEQNPASQLRQEGWSAASPCIAVHPAHHLCLWRALGELKKVGYDCAALREAVRRACAESRTSRNAQTRLASLQQISWMFARCAASGIARVGDWQTGLRELHEAGS